MKTRFFVHNMGCSDCASRVKQCLAALAGIREVMTDADIRYVEVEYEDSQVDIAAIRSALTVAGFKTSDVRRGDEDPQGLSSRIGYSGKKFAGNCLFGFCNKMPAAKRSLEKWGLRTKHEWFERRIGNVQTPDGKTLRLASVGENYLSFQLFWLGTSYYEPITTMVLEELVTSADVFIDAGANIGFFSLMLSLRQPKLKVIAFEPNPKNFKLLEENVAANRFERVHCEQVALCDRNGMAPFYLADSDMSASLRNDFSYSAQKTIQVRTTTLDAYIAAHELKGKIVIKADVEGAEAAFFEGARKTISALKPDIVCEVVFSHEAATLAWLRELGYRFYQITDQGLIETATLQPVLRGDLFFLNHLLSASTDKQIFNVFKRIEDRVRQLDLRKTSKFVAAGERERKAAGLEK